MAAVPIAVGLFLKIRRSWLYYVNDLVIITLCKKLPCCLRIHFSFHFRKLPTYFDRHETGPEFITIIPITRLQHKTTTRAHYIFLGFCIVNIRS